MRQDLPQNLNRQLLWFSLIGISITAPVVWLFYWPAGNMLDTVGYHLGRDFINMWTGPQIVDRFGVMMLFDRMAYHWAQSDIFGFMVFFHNWSYPIDILFIAYPFSWMPYPAALALWSVLGIATYVAVVLPRIPVEQRTWAIAALLIAPASLVNIVSGQNGFFTTGLMLGAIALLDRRPYLAGVLIGLLTMKPHLGVVIGLVLIVTFNWRAILSASVTTVVIVGASIAVWGIAPWVTYLTETSSYTWRILIDFLGFQTYMSISVLSSMRAFDFSILAAEIVQAAVSIVTLATAAVMFRRTNDIPLRALLVASGTFLASPYVFNYDLPILTAAVLWVMANHRLGTREVVALGLAWICAGAVWNLHLAKLGLTPLGYGGAFLVAVYLIVQQRSTAKAAMRSEAPHGLAQPA